jgi:hypothetical protein
MAASGVSCTKFSSSSDGGALILLARFSSLARDVFLLLCFGSRCLYELESDVSLYSSQYDSLDACCSHDFFWARFFPLAASFSIDAGHTDIPLTLLFSSLRVPPCRD